MNHQAEAKKMLREQIVERLSLFPEIQRVVVFGSFVDSDDPHDIDIAVFQDSDEGYYPLAMKYRKALRTVATSLPVDVIPMRSTPEKSPFLREIEKGEVLYER